MTDRAAVGSFAADGGRAGCSSSAAPAKVGRPKFEPTEEHRDLVRNMTLAGCTQEVIASCIKNSRGRSVSLPTLRKHFRAELDEALAEANAKVTQSLLKKALSDTQGSVTAAIFWLKSRADWKEVSGHEFKGDGFMFKFIDGGDKASGGEQ
jgi:hypothetical protein